MNIAIDYDGTYTESPVMWAKIIELMQHEGHQVVCVTCRSEIIAGDIKEAMGIPIIFSLPGRTKQDAATAAGIKIDVWIDNDPQHITRATLPPRQPLRRFAKR